MTDRTPDTIDYEALAKALIIASVGNEEDAVGYWDRFPGMRHIYVDRVRAVVAALRDQGMVVARREDPSACSDCGLETLLQGHHSDYSRPFEVEWLCSLCHGRRHRRDQG